MGKAYANKKKKEDRPVGDFYSTPKSLVWVAQDIIDLEFPSYDVDTIFEPCTGQRAIAEELIHSGYNVIENDLYPQYDDIHQEDYLEIDTKAIGMKWNNHILSNPPFSL